MYIGEVCTEKKHTADLYTDIIAVWGRSGFMTGPFMQQSLEQN